MSVRVSQFEAYLDFLNNYYQFSCDFLTMGRIKRLLALVKYFNFAQFTETSTQLNTRALAEIAGDGQEGDRPALGRPHRRLDAASSTRRAARSSPASRT